MTAADGELRSVGAHRNIILDALYLRRARLLRTPGARQILIAKRVNFRDDASDRWTARSVSPDFRICYKTPEMPLWLRTFRCPQGFFGLPPRSATRILVPGTRSPQV